MTLGSHMPVSVDWGSWKRGLEGLGVDKGSLEFIFMGTRWLLP